MHRNIRLLWRSLCFCLLAVGLLTESLLAADAIQRPNIILILLDDMGWRDVGFMGNTFIETPNIDRLAQRGLAFNQSYSAAPNCAPTRACLMSGQYTPRHGIYTVVDPRQPPGSPWHPLLAAESNSDLDTNIVTIAESLRDSGYATSFYGMWNLGRGRSGPVTPGGQGFQKVVFPENLSFAKDAYFNDQGEYLSDRLTDEVLAFMEEHREGPFFVYLPDHAVHAPFKPKPALLEKYTRKAETSDDRRNDPAYAATIEAVDDNVGRIVDRVNSLGLSERTYIVFTSDNGGTDRYTAPLRGAKGQLYEGGIRVPAVIMGPAIKKPGSRCESPICTVDWYPTFLELAGIKQRPKQPMDGISLLPAIRGAALPSRGPMFWHFPCYVGKATPSSAIRDGDFKLIEFFEGGGHRELYNLATDPGEEQDLAARMPDKADAMYRVLKRWQQETGAALPRGDNPDYQANAERPRGQQPASEPAKKRGGPKNGRPQR